MSFASLLEMCFVRPSFSLAGYQIVREGDDPEGRPAWAYPLGGWLIAYFCLQAFLRMIAEGPRFYMREWRCDRGGHNSGSTSIHILDTITKCLVWLVGCLPLLVLRSGFLFLLFCPMLISMSVPLAGSFCAERGLVVYNDSGSVEVTKASKSEPTPLSL